MLKKPAKGHADGPDEGLERLIFLSDGVFAIALTLLAIELHPPTDWDGTWAMLFGSLNLALMGFCLSFFVIAIYWANHRRTYERFQSSDAILTTLNLLFLALITLVPFFTKLIAEHGPRGEPLAIYMGLVIAIGVVSALQWGYAAFLGRDILRHPMGRPLKWLILLIQLIVPTMMAMMGLLAARPHMVWLYGVMVVFIAAILWLRRRVGSVHDHAPQD